MAGNHQGLRKKVLVPRGRKLLVVMVVAHSFEVIGGFVHINISILATLARSNLHNNNVIVIIIIIRISNNSIYIS